MEGIRYLSPIFLAVQRRRARSATSAHCPLAEIRSRAGHQQRCATRFAAESAAECAAAGRATAPERVRQRAVHEGGETDDDRGLEKGLSFPPRVSRYPRYLNPVGLGLDTGPIFSGYGPDPVIFQTPAIYPRSGIFFRIPYQVRDSFRISGREV